MRLRFQGAASVEQWASPEWGGGGRLNFILDNHTSVTIADSLPIAQRQGIWDCNPQKRHLHPQTYQQRSSMAV